MATRLQDRECDLDPRIARIAERAETAWAVPRRLAREAADATARRFDPDGEGGVSARRIEAYFWGVVRRRALRGGPGLEELRARYLDAAS